MGGDVREMNQLSLSRDVRRLKRTIALQCFVFGILIVGLAVAFVDMLQSLELRIDARMDEIESYNTHLAFQVNDTIKDFNNTVEKVQEDVTQQVKEVNDNVSSQNSLMNIQFAGTFSILGSLISFWHMTAHVRAMHEPIVQRKIIAIMWMVPIYSVSSWLGLVFVEASGILSVLKDIYEAYVIYTFLSFLIAVLARDGDGGSDRGTVISLLAKHVDHLKPPMQCPCSTKLTFQNPRQKAEAVLDQCQIFSMQFVLLRPITTVATVILDLFYEYKWAVIGVEMITNISIFFAFTGLMRFYHVVKDDLNWCHPFSKFLCIKGVVFMTFWQGVAISLIAHAVFKDEEGDDITIMKDAAAWSTRLQSFLIVLEMFFFAIAHHFVFPIEEWEPGFREREQRRIKGKFGDTLALRDFIQDVKVVMKSRKKGYHKKGVEKISSTPSDDSGDSIGKGDVKAALIPESSSRTDAFEIGDVDEDVLSSGWSRIEEYIDIVEEIEKGPTISTQNEQHDLELSSSSHQVI